jgi:predicted RNase H-like nuclease (RuvC/YqgF family)
MDNLVQQKDLKVLVTDIVQKLLTNFEEKITKKIEHVIWERTGKLQDQLDSLMIENENIREHIRAKDKIIESLEERVQDNTNRSIEDLKLGCISTFSSVLTKLMNSSLKISPFFSG